MTATKIYADADGTSHFGTISLDELNVWAKPGTAVTFVGPPPAAGMDFHPSKRKHMAIVLTGKIEIRVSDGSKKLFGPGSITYAEDLHGKGHASTVVEQPFSVALINSVE